LKQKDFQETDERLTVKLVELLSLIRLDERLRLFGGRIGEVSAGIFLFVLVHDVAELREEFLEFPLLEFQIG
jgi:hypothetical protein